MIIRLTLLLSGFCLLLVPGMRAQLPLVQGTSEAHSGMVYYNFHEADDLRPRTYLYTLCPPNASCLRLDFTLLESSASRDFIRVFDGPDRDAPLLGTLGGVHGSQLMQAASGCLTFEFTRAEAGVRSAWTALWRSQQTGDCIDPALEGPCEGVQDICGPEYRENRPLVQAEVGKPRPTRWYRFVAARDGQLSFTLLPDNGYDDFDWRLVAGGAAGACPLAQAEMPVLAENLARGRGALGATGMGETGDRLQEAEAGNPVSSSVSVEKGHSYFLQVSAPAVKTDGFRLLFNDVVLPCRNAGGDFLQVARKAPPMPVSIPAHKAFSRYTQVLRLALDEKANFCLTDCPAAPAAFAGISPPDGPKEGGNVVFPAAEGLVQALLTGLRTGRIAAYSADDFARPVHYGDLLAFAHRMQPSNQTIEFEAEDSIYGPVEGSYWTPDEALFAGFENVIELISDEFFDKQTGRKKSLIRYIRLVWTDWEGDMPDYNVAVFRYPDVVPLLEKIAVRNGHNDVGTLSLKDFLVSQRFSYLLTWRSGQAAGTPAQGKYMQDRSQLLENYKWLD